MPAKFPKRFFQGSRPRRLRHPEAQIHSCTACGTFFFNPKACPRDEGKRVNHRTPEFCGGICSRYWDVIV